MGLFDMFLSVLYYDQISRRNAKKHPFIPLHSPLFIKINLFNEKEDERGMRGACVAPL
jgi:hypothetical protein